MSKQLPASREEVAGHSAMRLEQMREAGIKSVELLGGSSKYKSCKASCSLRGQKIEINFATPVPLPDCDKEFCLCEYVARE